MHDADGDWEHTMTHGAAKVEYTPKIGTVVIIDLRIADVPRDIPVVESMAPIDVELTVGSMNWTVSNADSESYTGTKKVFFLSMKDGELLVHVG